MSMAVVIYIENNMCVYVEIAMQFFRTQFRNSVRESSDKTMYTEDGVSLCVCITVVLELRLRTQCQCQLRIRKVALNFYGNIT